MTDCSRWPVIAAIIIGTLIVLSILWCIFSCLCCGISLGAACIRCLSCGGCCGACRGSRRAKAYEPMPPTPQPYQGYQPPAQPMMYNNGPQFATFDAGNKRSANPDALPSMPSWDTAATRRVEDTSHRDASMEMEHMLPHNIPTSPVRGQHQQYSSDLGAQRLDQQQRGAANEFYDTPLSPAPTYYSTAPAGAIAHQTRHQFSPSHENYDYNSTRPYPSSRESTQFASSSRAMSPPTQNGYSAYHSPTPTYEMPQAQGARPPSLLQVGRKPVAGSYREV